MTAPTAPLPRTASGAIDIRRLNQRKVDRACLSNGREVVVYSLTGWGAHEAQRLGDASLSDEARAEALYALLGFILPETPEAEVRTIQPDDAGILIAIASEQAQAMDKMLAIVQESRAKGSAPNGDGPARGAAKRPRSGSPRRTR